MDLVRRSRIRVIGWAIALLASLGLWAFSYLNCSWYTRERAFGFLGGTFCWSHREPGSYGAREIFPGDSDWCWGTTTPDRQSCYVVVLPGKAKPHWKLEGSNEYGDLLRIDGRWTCYGFFGWQTYWKPYISRTYIILPLWVPCLVVLLLGIRPLYRLVLISRRRLHGQCLACGYSSTGNISGVCSECGMRLPGSDAADCDRPDSR